mgnify:CR=1 FL=1
MSGALADYKLHYEDINPKKTRTGGKDIIKMSKAKQQVDAPAKTYNKTRGEHFKDIVIVALVVSIIAFIGGMQFAKSNQAEVDRAVQAAMPTAQATEVKK